MLSRISHGQRVVGGIRIVTADEDSVLVYFGEGKPGFLLINDYSSIRLIWLLWSCAMNITFVFWSLLDDVHLEQETGGCLYCSVVCRI